MQFTRARRHSNSTQLHFSPGSTFIVGYNAPNVEVFSADKLSLIRSWPVQSGAPPDQIQWSPDGQYVLVSYCESGLVDVYITDPRKHEGDSPVATIQTGALGLRRVQWGPSGAAPCLMTFATDDLGMMIYSLIDGSKAFVRDVKRARYFPHPTNPHRIAVLTRSHTTSVESIQIYHYVNKITATPSTYTEILLQRPQSTTNLANNWTLESSFPINTNDAASLSWSSDGNLLVVWENQSEYKLNLFTSLGYWRGTFCIEPNATRNPTFLEPSSSCDTALSSIVEHQEDLNATNNNTAATTMGIAGGLGIKSIAWQPVHPDSPVSVASLAVGGYDEQVYFLSPFMDHPVAQSWGIMAGGSLDLSKRTLVLNGGDGSTTVHREPIRHTNDQVTPFDATSSSHTVPIPALRPDWDKSSPKVGISMLEWDPSGQYLAVRNDSMPSTLFIYHIPSAIDEQDGTFNPPTRLPSLLSVVFFSAALVSCVWRPGQSAAHRSHLAIGTTTTTAIYSWETTGVKRVALPSASSALSGAVSLASLKYSSDGRKLLIAWRGAADGDGAFCVALHEDDMDATDDSR